MTMGLFEQIKNLVKSLAEIIRIPRNAKVLDIGSGNNPFVRADILCERSVADDTERVGKIVIDRPLVMADVTLLPFIDNAFDVIVCCHLLEHLEKPEDAIKEIMRVGRSGIIEVPSEYFEKINSHPYHYWFITHENNILKFRPKSKPVFDEFLTKFFHEKIWLIDKHFMKFYNSNRYKYFNIRFHWKGKINYSIQDNFDKTIFDMKGFKKASTQISDQEMSNDDYTYQISKGGISFEIFPKFKIYIKKLLRLYYMNTLDIFQIIACPICKNKLIKEEQRNILVCEKCNLEYPIINNIPILLKENATQHIKENKKT